MQPDSVPLKTDQNPDSPAFSAAVAIVVAYLQKTNCSEEQIVSLLKNIHQVALEILDVENSQSRSPFRREKAEPAVPIKDSVSDDHLICLEDGRKVKSLKRHLRSRYNMTLADYREKWSLPDDYPVVAPALSRKRSIIAKQVRPHSARLRHKSAS
ncbi:MucR family transcriptional regulator [Microvirga sp. W0021]|uniref:MucR family transcriptional regulator n=1 Tax=Hohaiivirga grylli TaxID=3133970 RepID=A0ABV0BL84_9HYPH